MSTRILLLALAFTGTLLTGCSSDRLLHLNDGSTRVVTGKPQLDKATGMVIYTDEKGQQQAVNQSEIKGMSDIGN